MSRGHKGIRELIEATAKSLGNSIRFTYGRTSDFNMMRDKKYPFITLDPLNAVPQYTVNGVTNYMKAWNCQMAFYELDKPMPTPEDYTPILDEVDEIVDKFLNKLNFFTYQSDKIVLQNINQTSFIDATADDLSGFIVSFTLLAQDDFEYCEDDINCVIPDECGTD